MGRRPEGGFLLSDTCFSRFSRAAIREILRNYARRSVRGDNRVSGPSPYAFLVGDKVFYDPHPGAQLEFVQRVAKRVMTGEGPSKFFLRGNRGGGKSLTVQIGRAHV